MPDTKPAALNYAPPVLRTRAWLKRVMVLAWIGLTVYLLYDKWHPRVRIQLAMLDAQRTAARYVEPADRVVFEGDAERALQLGLKTDFRFLSYDGFAVMGSWRPQCRWRLNRWLTPTDSRQSTWIGGTSVTRRPPHRTPAAGG